MSADPPVTEILPRARKGEKAAADSLLPMVYRELRGLAQKYLGGQPADHTLQPTALVHEAFVCLAGGATIDWQDRAHFAAVAAKAMRDILIDHARAKGRQKRGGGWHRITLQGLSQESAHADIELIALDDALTKLAEADPEQAYLVELRFFAGMTIREIASTTGIARSTVQDDLAMAQVWLLREMGGGP